MASWRIPTNYKQNAIILALLLSAAAAGADFGDRVCYWTAPEKSSSEWCTGLTWDGDYIWCFVEHRTGYSYFYRCRPSDGSVVSSFSTTLGYDFHGCGMCYRRVGGNNFLDIMVYEDTVYNYFVYRYNFAGSFIASANTNIHAASIYHDGSDYWLVQGGSPNSTVFKVNSDFAPISSFVVSEPGTARGICKQADFFWLSAEHDVYPVFSGPFKTRPNGSVVASFENPVLTQYMWDCTFDGKYLWLVGDSNIVSCWDVSNAPAVAPSSIGKIKALYR
jgi:hypothetical protein